MAKHLVLDIETLGTKPGYQILSIGAVCGDDTFYLVIQHEPALEAKIDYDTMIWWMTVPHQAARNEVFGAENKVPLGAALVYLREFIKSTKPDLLWGNSPDFGHLAYWYRTMGDVEPWEHHQLRDIRTIRSFMSDSVVKLIKGKYLAHHALCDATMKHEILMNFLAKVEQK